MTLAHFEASAWCKQFNTAEDDHKDMGTIPVVSPRR
jgi:hypothetical protein